MTIPHSIHEDGKWGVFPLDDYTYYHVIPLNDLIEHELTEDCICGPAVTMLAGAEGDCWQISHPALDGRE